MSKDKNIIFTNMSMEEFNQLYAEFYPSLLAYAHNFVTTEEAEDIVQDTMVWLWEKRNSLQIISTLRGYLFLAVRNNCLTAITQGRARTTVVDYFPENLKELQYSVNSYLVEELSQKINEALERLPENYRIVFEMNRFQEKTYKEIADELNLSTKAIEYRMSQALILMRKELKDYLPFFFIALNCIFSSR